MLQALRNCAAEAGGCEAEMMFVRPGDFDERLVRAFCTAGRPHSCGPGSWSLEQDRGSWDAPTRAWAAEQAKGWPPPAARHERRRGLRGLGGRHKRAGRQP